MLKKMLTICVGIFIVTPARAEDKSPAGSPLFESHVRPILKAHCFECHGEGRKLKGGLDVRLARLIARGGESGPGLVQGRPEDSTLIERLRKGEMPPGKKKLSKDEIGVIARWIGAGAKTARPEPEKIVPGLYITEEERSFWAFQPVARPTLPRVGNPRLVRSPIDAFLLARLEKQGLSFAPEAHRVTLIRRLSFDLLGLPPSPDEVARFVGDEAPDAYERLVERLLASPQYGERWGRHWLDVAGYADSEGYSEQDPIRTNAYRYRDYVIRAFNDDKPFDQFIIEQLAGDELVKPPHQNLRSEDIDKLIATGFLRMAADGTASGAAPALAGNQVIADTLQIVGTSLLGLTMHCAQCHNHRYDPIPQVDYYKMRAVFEPALNPKAWRVPAQRQISLYTAADRRQAQVIESEATRIDQQRLKKQDEYIERTFQKELARLPVELRDTVKQARNTPAAKRTAEQQKLLRDHPSVNVSAGSLYLYDPKAAADLKQYVARANEVRARKPVEHFIRVLTEPPGVVPATFLFHRGDHEQPRETLEPGGLTVLASLNLASIPVKDPALPTTGRRLAYARSLVSGKHPLTARVLVNRFWMHHFGRGIVATPADFGFLGERPTHPELLDWLADDFMAGGWRLKRLHRLLLTSTAYRQGSQRTAVLQKTDPDNKLLARMSVRRLEAEIVRDAMLAVSGKINLKQHSTPVPVMHDDFGQVVLGVDTADSAGYKQKEVPLNGEEFRRSVYVQVRRTRLLSVLDTFDAPVMAPNCESRNASTVTPQALMLMNSPFMMDLANHFAARVRAEAGTEPATQAKLAWRLAYAVEAPPQEVRAAAGFITEQAAQYRAQKRADADVLGLAALCQALMSSNRFLYVD
ncbi:MAG: DUF1549 domain-containing protein [Planctomycetes bacterium]|nr:DUF1549 domain-containing protein [Planctomycetota bacterium]